MKTNKVLELASRLVEGRVRRYNGGLMPRDQKVCRATEAVYVREDQINRIQTNPLMASFAIPVVEFEQLCKTKLGCAYVSSYRWRRYNLQSLLG